MAEVLHWTGRLGGEHSIPAIRFNAPKQQCAPTLELNHARAEVVCHLTIVPGPCIVLQQVEHQILLEVAPHGYFYTLVVGPIYSTSGR